MKKEWEVLVMGASFESENIFKEVAELDSLHEKGKITERELEDKIEELEDRDEEFGLEISVIKKDNRHGHESYGCGEEDKIILWDSGGSVGNSMYTGNVVWCKKVAELLCDSMNKEGM